MATCMKAILFPGCAANDLVQGLGDLWFRILNKIFTDVDYLKERICCGMPFLLSGRYEQAAKCGEKLLSFVENYDILITGCPSCYRMLKYFYPEKLGISSKIEVLHLVNVLYDSIRTKKITPEKPVRIRVTYHDPCELCRHMKICDEPRYILNSIPGLDFVELEMNRSESTCCGGGGLMRALYPRISQEIAINKILNEVAPLDVSAIVTSCPFCKYVLEDAINFIGSSIRVMDISEIVLMAIGG